MSRRATMLRASALVVLAVGLHAAGFALYLAGGALGSATTDDLLTSVITVTFCAVGWLVAVRHPGNAIGWLFLGVAVCSGVDGLVHGYVAQQLAATATPGTFVATAGSVADVAWIPVVFLPPTFLLLLFPDGRLRSRRWRPIAWAAGAGIAGVLATTWVIPGPLLDFPELRNRYGIDSPLLDPLTGLAYLALLVGVVGSAWSVVVRFRHGRAQERQQIKWLAVAGVVAVVAFVVNVTAYEALGPALANAVIIVFGVLGLPAAAGIAILRYRLYEIDVVINRALVYGSLTTTLAACYLGSVLLLQLAFSAVTEGSGLAIAASTLAVAGLVRPVRARIQATVDRRFFRRKYDAAQTLERFGAHLRDEVDLDALGDELRAVVSDTMQPAHVSLWLRAGPS